MRLVDADELMKTYARFVASSNNSDFENEPTWNDAVSLLESAPTVNAKPVKHGYWVDVNGDGSLWRCSVCGETQCCYDNYCGNCGAQMDKQET